MEHKGTVLIETNRLILRKFRLEDSEAAFSNWTSDDQVTKFLRWPTHQNLETTEKIIKMWVDSYTDKSYYQWAIVPKNNDDKPIGTISVVDQVEQNFVARLFAFVLDAVYVSLRAADLFCQSFHRDVGFPAGSFYHFAKCVRISLYHQFTSLC